ncbi:uncharacterized protein LOC113554366 [Rhopalosiphum maidis]|uniref:uncharacterized protein LOC113554366 n=1 Tax=Rhopalosiphum maidis TaxID=43146 RepID=UPI000F0040C5|nr:uncharacterized protein LOC113554366 [Rhopalosiphum maidis]
MKCLLINLIVFVTLVNSNISKRLSLPQLPFGMYRLNFLGVMRCDSFPTNNKLKYELYLSKKSANTTEIKGIVTNLIPLDDSIDLEFNLAVKDSIGGWKDNAFLYKTPKACSSLKKFLGPAWTPIMDSAGLYNATCPLPAGVYKVSGIDTGIFMTSGFPKSFFYGTYRFRLFYSKKNEVYGCFIIIIEIKRPWETE